MFFNIQNADAFRKVLGTLEISSSADVSAWRKLIDKTREATRHLPKQERLKNLAPVKYINVAFSAQGLRALGIKDPDIGDEFFTAGQGAHAVNFLGDRPVKFGDPEVDWDPEYKRPIHGIFLVAAHGPSLLCVN